MNNPTYTIVTILFAVIFTHCGDNTNQQVPNASINGYVYDTLEAPVGEANIVLVETIYSPNLTGNNDGFSKNKTVLGSTISNQDGSFKINFERSNLGGLNELVVTKDNYSTSFTPITISDQVETSINIGVIQIEHGIDLSEGKIMVGNE